MNSVNSTSKIKIPNLKVFESFGENKFDSHLVNYLALKNGNSKRFLTSLLQDIYHLFWQICTKTSTTWLLFTIVYFTFQRESKVNNEKVFYLKYVQMYTIFNKIYLFFVALRIIQTFFSKIYGCLVRSQVMDIIIILINL